MAGQTAEHIRDRVSSVLEVVLMLSDEELWEFVQRMLPNADDDTIEDIYDILVYKKHKDDAPEYTFEEVFDEKLELSK